MLRVIATRLLWSIVTLLVVSVLTFSATELLPGNAASAVLGKQATPQALRQVDAELHLNESPVTRYLHWISGIAHGNLGRSLSNTAALGGIGQTVANLIGPLIGNSALLMLVATLIIIPLAILAGVLSALKPGGLLDSVVSSTALVFGSIPTFVTGTALIWLFAITLPIFPALSLVSSSTPIGTRLAAIVLPVATLATYAVAPTARILRGNMIEVLSGDFVRMARLRGISERRVIWRYALPNAIVPAIQAIALTIAWMAGGIVVVEVVFDYPGIGQGLTNAVGSRDIPTVQALVLLIAALYVGVNLIADVVTMLMDPKIRRAATAGNVGR